MTAPAPAQRTFSRTNRLWRIAFVFGVAAVLATLRVIDPESTAWFPFRTSCGAVTGLPCLFCGTTRAMHYLLNGEVARAIYFNWLAIPLLVAAVTVLSMLTVETAISRPVFQKRFAFRLTRRHRNSPSSWGEL